MAVRKATFGLTLSLSKGEAAAPSLPKSSVLRPFDILRAQDEDFREISQL
jgi:hypothetical protein